jgi:N utilization substance protein B
MIRKRTKILVHALENQKKRRIKRPVSKLKRGSVMTRKLARKATLFSLYSFKMREEKDAAQCAPKRDYDFDEESFIIPIEDYHFAHDLYVKAIAGLDDIDKIISDYSTNWDIDRISVIDRNILRLAIAEFLFFPEIAGRVTINEAVELAKNYGGEESFRFINGILDTVMKRFKGDADK